MRIAIVYRHFKTIIVLSLIISNLVACAPAQLPPSPTPTGHLLQFQGTRAFEDVATQMDFGPRLPGSEAHAQTRDWIVENLEATHWEVEVQKTPYYEFEIQNIVAKRGEGAPWVILGAHYDTRIFADQDPDITRQKLPVPGANDGASGVAVLLELARVLPEELPGQVWLVFFDAEDNGRTPPWDWILGSRTFVQQLDGLPDAVVVVDMIGDADLNIFREKNSNQKLTQEIWREAEALGYEDHFLPSAKYRIIDDHLPFLEAGIAAVDIIDFDYAYWHTTEDTLDKVSAESLQIVGDVVLSWLLTKLSIETVP